MNWMNVFAGALFVGLSLLWVYTTMSGKNVERYVSLSSSTLDAA